MKKSNNPFFGDDQSHINIDQMAEEMALQLKKLNQKNQKLSILEKPDFSDNSMASLPKLSKLNLEQDYQIISVKRENAIKINPIPRKKGRAQSEYQHNDDSEYIDSISNKNIADFFNTKQIRGQALNQKKETKQQNGSNEEQIDEEELSTNPIVKGMRQKIQKKQKIVEELHFQVQKIRERNQKIQEQYKNKKQTQLSFLLQYVSQKYDEKIFKQSLNQILEANYRQRCKCKRAKRFLEEIPQKIKMLANEKTSKRGSKGSKSFNFNQINNQDNPFLEAYSEERQSYLMAWKKKLQSEKLSLEKEVSKAPIYQEIDPQQQENYLELPDIFLDEDQNRKMFEQIYFPLYCRATNDQFTQIRVLNISKLGYENLTMLSYPKTMKKQKRIQLKVHIKQIYQKSISLQDDSHSIFTNNTLFSQVQTLSCESIVLGRTVWEQENPINLKYLMKRYQCLPEGIVKYITKIIIRAYERIRREISNEGFIFPQNIIFNERNDIKIDNWIMNEVYRFSQSHQYLLKDGKYLYLPPEYKVWLNSEENKTTGFGIWSIGVIAYEMLFGKKPFQYNHDVDHEQFYIMNELQFPVRPQVSENCKQFLKLLLCKYQNRITFEKALKHIYFDSKKS